MMSARSLNGKLGEARSTSVHQHCPMALFVFVTGSGDTGAMIVTAGRQWGWQTLDGPGAWVWGTRV